MFWSSGIILLCDIATNRITIEVDLVKWCGASIVLQNSSASVINNPDFCTGIAVRALKLFSVFAELEDLCLVHVLSATFDDASLNQLIFYVWLIS